MTYFIVVFCLAVALNILDEIRLIMLKRRNAKLFRMLAASMAMDGIMFDCLRVITLNAKGHDPLKEARQAIGECGRIAAQFMENENA